MTFYLVGYEGLSLPLGEGVDDSIAIRRVVQLSEELEGAEAKTKCSFTDCHHVCHYASYEWI